MSKKKVTLSIEEKVYNEFQKFCEQNAIMLSKKVELVMKQILQNKKLKTFLFFVFIQIILINLAAAATIFSDDFESGTLSGWTLSTPGGGNNWTNSLTDPFQGSRHAQSQPQDPDEPASVMERAISTVGYQSINVNYRRKLVSIDIADEFQMEWFDGSSWIILEQTGSSSPDDPSYVLQSFDLPSSANENPNFRIKFECTAGAVSEFCRVDNVIISGISDSSPPLLTLNSPLNNQFINTPNVTFNITLNENGSSVFYSLNNGITNISMSTTDNRNYNATNTSIADGIYTARFFANDTAGNRNDTTQVTFTIDTTRPQLSLVQPQNTSYNTTSLSINFTASDTNLQSCWYTTNNGASNTTLTNCANTTLTASQSSTTLTIYANDSANNINSSSVTFFVDSITPLISYTEPTQANNSFTSQSSIFINTTITEANFASITFTLHNSTSLVNTTTFTTQTLSINFTSLPDTTYFYNITINDTLGNSNSTETRTLTIDTTSPQINFVSPTQSNNSFTAQSSIFINTTITETNFANITFTLYNITSLINRTTFTTQTFSINFTNLPDTTYFYNVTIKDLANNQNTTETRTITLDTTTPSLTLEHPEPKTYGTNVSLPLNFTASDTNLQSCWYNLNNSNNISLPNCQNTTFNQTDGTHTLYLFANDSANNLATTNVTFTILTTAPALNLLYPQNNSFINYADNVYFNYSAVSGIGISSCQLLGNFNGTWHLNQTNSTITLENNFFVLNLLDNTYNWGIICNDTQNRVSNINYTFSIDTIFPSLTLTQPTGTKTSRNNIPIEFTASDTNLQACWYNVQRGAITEISNTSLSCASSSSFSVTVDADFILNFYVNDSANNINSSSSSFTVTTSGGNPPGGGGGGGGGGGSSGGGGGGGGGFLPSARRNLNATAELNLEITKPESIAIKRGTSSTFELTLTNLEKTFINNCKLEIRGILSQSIKNNQQKGLAPNEKFTFNLEIAILQNTAPGQYPSNIVIQCDEGKASTNIEIAVFRNSFEAKLNNYEKTNTNKLRVSYTLEEFAKENHDIILNYELLDLESIPLTKGEERITLTAGQTQNYILEFELPKDALGELNLKLIFNDGKIANELNEKVILASAGILGLAISEGNRRTLSTFGIILLSGLAIFFLSRFVYKKIKLRRTINELKAKHSRRTIKLDLHAQKQHHLHHHG